MSLYLVYEKKRRKLKNTFYETTCCKFCDRCFTRNIVYSFFWPGCKRKRKREVKDTKKEVEEITIIRKSDDKTKTVVEINGDKITVNGKPIEDLKDGNITVHRGKYKTMEGLNAYYSMNKGKIRKF